MRKSFGKFFKEKKRKVGIVYDYSDALAREETVSALLENASDAKREINEYWKKMKRYYDGVHDNGGYTEDFAQDNGLPFKCACSSDGYIHVESQIDPVLPEFEFSPRGNDDAGKAKQRERLVRYICDRNDMEYRNSRNERRLGILGSAVWKVCWDSSRCEDGNEGDILIDNPHPGEIFPDPGALCVDDCEYIGYVYRMHREKARRTFSKELWQKGLDFDSVISSGYGREGFCVSSGDNGFSDDGNDTVTVTEWWFRQPQDGEADFEYFENGEVKKQRCSYRAGDIALCVFVCGTEVRYIPKYWNITGCSMFPFVIYDKLPGENSLWGKSELEAIIPFIDAADREIAYAQLNSAFSSNDIIVAEENALCDDCELDNSPGAVWKLRPGMMGRVQRLGNNSYSGSYLHANYDKWRILMQETTGNFSINQGNEPEKVTTATGIALLNERAKNRKSLKKIDKSAGFKRLYELCDRTALEYYDDGRVILCGAAEEGDIVYSASDYLRDGNKGKYVPGVDIKVRIGDGLANSKAFTVSAMNSLISTPVTADNYRLVKSYLELIDIPMRKEICDMLDERFGAGSLYDGLLEEIPVGGTEDITEAEKAAE